MLQRCYTVGEGAADLIIRYLVLRLLTIELSECFKPEDDKVAKCKIFVVHRKRAFLEPEEQMSLTFLALMQLI